MDINKIKDIKINFILASARTGSTLLSAMLNMHPHVISTTEEPFTYTLYPKYKNIEKWTSEIIQEYCHDFYLFSEGKLKTQFSSKKELEIILEKYKPNLTFDVVIKLTYLCFFPNKNKNEITTVVDKQLEFHSNLEEVAEIYPQSKFLILFRDPRDQILSRYLMAKKRNEKNNKYLFWSYVWNYKYATLLEKSSRINGSRFLEIKYEDLILNPEKELQKICSFFDIPFRNVMLEYDDHFKKMGKDVSINISVKEEFLTIHSGLTEKVNKEKIGLWKKELNKNDADLIWTICGNLAEKIGYKKDENFTKQNLTLNNRVTFVDFFIKRIIILKMYRALPFFVKYFIKKIKYEVE